MNAHARQRGFSLVELAVVLVVLGLVTLLLVQFLGTASRERHEIASRDLLTRADDALLAYAMINSRLPCPAANGSGLENCGSGQVGLLPYKTLGLPDANARRIRYGLLRRANAADPRKDADLGQGIDRFYPLKVFSDTGTTFPLGNVNGLDLCWALRNAQTLPLQADFLHVTRAESPSQPSAHVAYALALPPVGEGFGGHQVDAAPVFDSPRRTSGSDYRDKVVAVGLDQLWTRMRCGDNLATAGHAHFNSAATVALMHKSLKDYKSQLAVAKQMAEANRDSGIAAVLSGTSAVADAAGGVADTVSEGLASTGVVAYRVALGVIATAAAVAVTITAGVMVGFAQTALDSAEDAYRDVDPLIDGAAQLQSDVEQRAQDADKAGIY